MYEDSWYSFVDIGSKRAPSNSPNPGHRRKESLLQQPNGPTPAAEVAKPLQNVYEDLEDTNTPPEPTILRRASSYTDFYHVVKAQLSKDGKPKRKRSDKKDRSWEALMLLDSVDEPESQSVTDLSKYDDQLMDAAQQDYLLYRDQLTLTERHLDGLINDANATLKLLTTLSDSFKSVEDQTSTFQSQCEDLLSEQRRLEKLAYDVGTDIHYYQYLETATRRLNAPGAGRLVEDGDFRDMVENIDACIEFMNNHETYRDRDSYLARYHALLTKSLHLLEHGFTKRLEKVSSDIARQIGVSKSESARHALAYGRFEELMLDSYELIPNVQRVIGCVYDQFGRPVESSTDNSVYVNTAKNIFHTYLTTRDRDLKVMTQSDQEEFQKEIKELSAATATRNYIKQCFERTYNEENIFLKLFNVEPMWSTAPESAFLAIKTINTTMIHPGHMTPLATSIQSALQGASLEATCNLVSWLASEFSIAEPNDEESPFFRKSREYAARLLVENLWPYTDKLFDAEVTKSIARATVQDDSLKIGPVIGGVASSNAHVVVKRAMELLSMYDRSMPKERSSKNNPIVFKIVRETIQVLQRAEARIRSLKSETDPGLFMVKNLLIIKNELLSLEIGDIRSQTQSMQHFTQIWDTLSPQNWVSFFSSFVPGSLWSRGTSSVTAKTLTVEDMSEQLDELLRQSIYAFTQKWGGLINDARSRKPGVKPIAKIEAELDGILITAFSNQPEVIGKLKEAIELNAQAQSEAKEGKKSGVRRY